MSLIKMYEEKRKLSTQEKSKLVDKLLEIDMIKNVGSRQAVLNELRSPIPSVITYDPIDRVHVMNIVDKCLDYLWGLEQLIEVLYCYEADSLALKDLEEILQRIFPKVVTTSELRKIKLLIEELKCPVDILVSFYIQSYEDSLIRNWIPPDGLNENQVCSFILDCLAAAPKNEGILPILKFVNLLIQFLDKLLSVHGKETWDDTIPSLLNKLREWMNLKYKSIGYKTTIEVQQAFHGNKQDLIEYMIDKERQYQEQFSIIPQRVIKIDKHIITDYDLHSQMSVIAQNVMYGKSSAFIIGGDYYMLKDYVIERMCQKLQEIFLRPPFIVPSISINDRDVGNDLIIMEKVLSENDCGELVDLLEIYSGKDIVLIIWSYNCSLKPLIAALSYFWKEVEQKITPLLQAQGSSFVLIVAHIGSSKRIHNIDNFIPLQIIEDQFTKAAIEPWIRRKLQYLNFEPTIIEQCLKKFRSEASMIENYHQIGHLIDFLQGRF